MLSDEAQIAVNHAVLEAQRRQHEYVTVEHLLLALLLHESVQEVVKSAGASHRELRAKLEAHLDQNVPSVPSSEADLTVGFRRVLGRAMRHLHTSGKDAADAPGLLVAMFAEPDCFAKFLLESNGVTRLAVTQFISHGIRGATGSTSGSGDRPLVDAGGGTGGQDDDDEKDGTSETPLSLYATNLNALAEAGKIDVLIGRAVEVERTVQVLARRRKNNPLYVGDSGVGKTALAEGLARRIVEGEVPDALKGAIIYALDMGQLLAGTRYRGDFEERLVGVLKEIESIDGAILFIDEIHTVIHAGAVEGGTMDASNLLKPALASGRLRCIGSTTFKEYRSGFEKDRALSRRFQRIDVDEPSVEDAIKILQGLQPTYEEFHGVTYEGEAIERAVTLSAKHIHDRRLPDKAIDLIDEAGAYVKLRPDRAQVVDASDIREVVSRVAKIPSEDVKLSDRDRLRDLEADLRGVVFGQDEAIREVVSAVKLARAGIGLPDRPMGVFIFTGPTGVGKTEVARQLALTLGIEMIRFDMSEYMERHSVSRLIGAPPGYVGYDQGGQLTEAVSQNPHAVILLDEIEKAHPDVFNILLQVMDSGRLTDNTGRTADFRNVILIMTSNVGARELSSLRIGFSKATLTGSDEEAYKRAFSPEFRNRLDARVRFAPLAEEVMDRIVIKFLHEMAGQLAAKAVRMTWSDAVVALLAREGFDVLMGARPLARIIKQRLKVPMSDALLFGELADGGEVWIDVADDAPTFTYQASKALEPADDDVATLEDASPKGDATVVSNDEVEPNDTSIDDGTEEEG